VLAQREAVTRTQQEQVTLGRECQFARGEGNEQCLEGGVGSGTGRHVGNRLIVDRGRTF